MFVREGKNAMDKYLGGYIFIPIVPEHSPADIVMMTVQRMATLRDIRAVFIWQADDEDWVDVPLSVLCRAGRGCVRLYIDGLDCMLHFDLHADTYYRVAISVYTGFLLSDRYRCAIETFVGRWMNFCEEMQAVFGYFGRLSHMTEPAYRDTVMLPALRQGDVAALSGDLSLYWLLYFGPELATQGREIEAAMVNSPLPLECMTVRDIPTGGLFIRTTTRANNGDTALLWETQRDIDQQSGISW